MYHSLVMWGRHQGPSKSWIWLYQLELPSNNETQHQNGSTQISLEEQDCWVLQQKVHMGKLENNIEIIIAVHQT